jgi:hypothetical protein
MTQVIIYTNSNGNVSVCTPTGELPIEIVLTKDCPAGAIIVDDSTLPQGDDAQFFNSWVLSGSTVSVDMTKAMAQATSQFNHLAYSEFQNRAAKAGIGLTNVIADSDWSTALSTATSAIAAAKSTSDLVAALAPIQSAIAANAL